MYTGGLWCLTPLFKNISVISWWSVLLVEETGLPWGNHWSVTGHWQTLSPGGNHWPVTGHWQTLIMLYWVHLAWAGFKLTMLVVIGTDCIHVGSCKSNYHTITTMTAPRIKLNSYWCCYKLYNLWVVLLD